MSLDSRCPLTLTYVAYAFIFELVKSLTRWTLVRRSCCCRVCIIRVYALCRYFIQENGCQEQGWAGQENPATGTATAASLIETLQTFDVYKVQGLIVSPGNLSDFLSFYDDNPDFRSSFGVILSPQVLVRTGEVPHGIESGSLVRHNRDFDDLLCSGPRPP